MQNENNRQRLEKAFPPMDAAFDHAVRSTLENIVQEDTMQVKRPLRVLAITLALVICLAGTALAVGSGLNLFNFFEDIGSPSPTVQPEAYTLTAHDVASHSFEHTDVAVREAAWDGRVLRILYSVRDRTVDRVFTDEDIWDGNYDLPGARQDGITADWGCDYVYVNGVSLCMTGYMASRAGSEPGEVLVALESDLVERIASEKADITLGDTFEVWLPIIGMGGKDETPADLHFTVKNTDLVGVRHIALPEKTVLADGTEIAITNFMITPIRVYVQAIVTLPAGLTDEEIDAHVWGISKESTQFGQEIVDGGRGIINAPKQEFVSKDDGTSYVAYHMPEGERPVMRCEYVLSTSDSYPEVFKLTIDGTEISVPNVDAK